MAWPLIFSSIACSAITNLSITGTTPSSVACPKTLCQGKADGNFKYTNPTTKNINKSYFLQCVDGEAFCQACWPLDLQFSEKCNQCLYSDQDECITTSEFVPATTFECPDKCPLRGPTFTGNIADVNNARQYIGCFEGMTIGCIACPGKLEFNEKENACLFEGKFITEPSKTE